MLEGVLDLRLKVGLGVRKTCRCLTPHEGLSMVLPKLDIQYANVATFS
jgi:hypothetical protein